jgi:hypothetical protein
VKNQRRSSPPLSIRSTAEYLERLRELRLIDQPQYHVRWWFRGQPDGSPLYPGVYRDAFPAGTEAERLDLERRLYQDFRVLSAGLFSPPPSDVDLYFFQQHYGLPTRLLDWTTNPLAALYFAVNQGTDTDGSVVLMDVFRLAETQRATAEFRGVVLSNSPVLRKWLSPILDGSPPGLFCDFVVPIRPEQANPRVRLQRSCFTLHVPRRPGLTDRENDSLRRLVIPKADKPTIYQELKLSGIDEFAIFGDPENLAVSLRTAYRL